MSEPKNGLTVYQPKTEVALSMQAAGAPGELVHIAESHPHIAQRAFAILASRPVDQYSPPLHPARAIAAALYEQNTGQVYGRDFYVDNRMGVITGYRGLQMEVAERNLTDMMDDYRLLRPDELEEHEIGAGDTARICELSIPSRAKVCRDAGIPYKPTIGIGIVRASEKVNKEGRPIQLNGGFTWVRKARTRAYKDALRHAGFAATAREVIEDAQRGGLDLGLSDDNLDKLSREQAVYATGTAKRKQEQAYAAAEQQAAVLLAETGSGAPQPPPPAGGDPWAAERAFICAHPLTDIAPERRVRYAERCLGLLFGQTSQMPDRFIAEFFGATDLQQLDAEQLAGIIEFIAAAPDKSGQYVPSDAAIAFASRFRAAQEGPADSGLLFDEEEDMA